MIRPCRTVAQARADHFKAQLHDNRRRPHYPLLPAEQLSKAKADITHHSLETGHGLAPDNFDLTLARSWLEANFYADELIM